MTDQTATKSTLHPLLRTCLWAAPAMALIARTLLTPYWDDPQKYLSEVAANPGRSDIGASLVIISALLFIGAGMGLAVLVRGHMPRTASTAAVLTVIGSVGMASISTAALVAGQMARLGNQPVMVDLWDHVWNDPKMWTILLVHLGAVGFVVFGVALYRSAVVHRALAVLVGVGGAAVLTTSAGPVRPALLAAAALSLMGLAGVAVMAGTRGVAPLHSGRDRVPVGR